MPGVRRVLQIVAVLALIAGLAGCGSGGGDSGKIPSDLASELLTPLNAAQANAAAGQCTAVQSNAQDFAQRVSQIGKDEIDPAIKQKLVEASQSLKDLAVNGCEQTPTGASGAQGASTLGDAGSKGADSVAQAPTTISTPEEPTTEPAQTEVKPPAKAKPKAPARATKQHGSDQGPPKNGPPGPAGNPNQGSNDNSGGVSPRPGH